MKIIVSNTTPIISLASIGKLDILKTLFSEIIIAEAVYQEIKAKKRYGYNEVDREYIQVKAVQGKIYTDLLLNQLDLGEAETIILAKEINADFFIIDENLGYKIAKNADLNATRTLSILLKAKQKGIITEIKPLLVLCQYSFDGCRSPRFILEKAQTKVWTPTGTRQNKVDRVLVQEGGNIQTTEKSDFLKKSDFFDFWVVRKLSPSCTR